jgi:type IV secretory pathway component VirB8
MKTINDLKKTIKESKVEDYQIQQSIAFKNTFTIQLTTKEVFSMPVGYNVTSFSFAGLPESKAIISFTVNF